MYNIDQIMDLLDWHNTPEEQAKGISLAKNIKCINVFIQPLHQNHNKNVWDNCAIILSKKTDLELRPYLSRLLEWLMDMNWPGAYCIKNRLLKYTDKEWFNYMLKESIRCATALGEDIWLSNLLEFID